MKTKSQQVLDHRAAVEAARKKSPPTNLLKAHDKAINDWYEAGINAGCEPPQATPKSNTDLEDALIKSWTHRAIHQPLLDSLCWYIDQYTEKKAVNDPEMLIGLHRYVDAVTQHCSAFAQMLARGIAIDYGKSPHPFLQALRDIEPHAFDRATEAYAAFLISDQKLRAERATA